MYPRLWTLEAETAAAQHRQEIAEGKRSDDLTTDIPYRDGKDKPYLWEGYFYQILYGVVSKRGGCLQSFNILSGNSDPKVLWIGQSPGTRAAFNRPLYLSSIKAAKHPSCNLLSGV